MGNSTSRCAHRVRHFTFCWWPKETTQTVPDYWISYVFGAFDCNHNCCSPRTGN